jgi:TRAP-type C4-dicarboxylate transport system permease small subunit
MWIRKAASCVDRTIRRLSAVLANIAAATLAMMMFLMVADVVGRYVGNSPILGAFEITEFMMIVLLFFSVGYAQTRKAHINVDVLILKLPKNVRRFLQTIGSLLGLGLFSLIAWQAVMHATRIYKAQQRSIDLGLPVFPFILVAALGTAVFCLTLLASAIRSASGNDD